MSNTESFNCNSNQHQSPTNLFQNLVKLPHEILQLIILKLSKCKGGLQSILSLRAATSTTKAWIDEGVSETFKQKLYSNTEINVPLNPHSVKQFLSTKPSFPVTSLHLSSSDEAEDINAFRYNLSEEAKLIWNEFIYFWSSRLETLQISFPEHDLCVTHIQFLFCSCPFIKEINTTVSAGNILCNRTSIINKLVFFETKWIAYDDRKKAEIFEQILLAKSNLKLLEIPINRFKDMRRITKFITATSEDCTLRLTLNVHVEVSPIERELNDDKITFHNFVRTVVSSNSSIKIAYLSDTLVLDLQEHVGVEVTKAFFGKVIHMSQLLYFKDNNQCPRVAEFENLRRIDRYLPKFSEDSQLNVKYPESLRRLRVFGVIDPEVIGSLPSWLTSLEIFMPKWENVQEIVTSLIAIDTQFPALSKLKLSNTFSASGFTADYFPSLSEDSFKNLLSLKIDLKFKCKDKSKCSRYILKEILKINLRVQKLTFSSFGFGSSCSPMELNSDCARLITQGTYNDSLLFVSFDTIQFEDEKDKEMIVSLANSNLKKHRQHHKTTNTKCHCFDD